ncbi:MAG: type II toxin-antitoxin system RelE/ParE family toxin [Bacteroidales bacterium]|jgi:hypothetical protein|nr:type II toxin-antitoxin system RelE/ParE family toxin [Bacteroidales bacterium]
MATKQLVNIGSPVQLKIKRAFKNTLSKEVLPYTMEHFGTVVGVQFLNEIYNRILMLYTMPNANPKNSNITSTKNITYRNIIFKKYPFIAVYSVQNNVVTVINIISTSQSPQQQTKIIKQSLKEQ